LLAIIRNDLDDNGAVRLWSDTELAGHVQEGQVKFAKDTRILKDGLTVGEVLASSVITLTGVAGQVDSVKVDGVTITSSAVPFVSDLPAIATDLAANINAVTPSLGYTADASAADGTLKISAMAGTGANPNGYSVVVAASGGDLAGTAPAMSGGTSICQMYFLAGVNTYGLDPRIFIVESMEQHGGRNVLIKKSLSWMNKHVHGWKSAAPGTPRFFITDAAPHTLLVWPTPKDADTYDVTLFRKPMDTVWNADGTTVNNGLVLEVDDEFIEGVKYWARRCAYLKDDAETLTPQKSAEFEQRYDKFVENTKRSLLLAGQI
jgi:hypothetical protein